MAAHPIAYNQELAEALGRLALADAVAILVVITSLADIRTSAMTYLHGRLPNSTSRLLSGKYITRGTRPQPVSK
jgi:hypothetical protein